MGIDLNGYITVREAAERLGITKRGAWVRVYLRGLKTVRVGNLDLVRADEVLAPTKKGNRYTARV